MLGWPWSGMDDHDRGWLPYENSKWRWGALTAMPIERKKKKIEVVEFKSKHKILMLLPFACISQALELKERLGALDRWRKG